jgi:hypothetical protein
MNLKDVPRLLRPHFITLRELVQEKKFKEAEQYLNNLHPRIYDEITARSCRQRPFSGIFSEIEKTKKSRIVEVPDKTSIKTQSDLNYIF